MNLHSKQVNLNVLSSFVTLSGPFEIFVDDIFSSIMASVSELLRVECWIGTRLVLGDFRELKLCVCSFSLCFFNVPKLLAEKSHIFHEKGDPVLYLTLDLLTCFGARFPRASLLYSSILYTFADTLYSKNGFKKLLTRFAYP